MKSSNIITEGARQVPSTPLSEKLRELRMSRWPGAKVLQSRVARALGVATPSISAYEKGAVPPPERLRDYALLFSSERWLQPGAPDRVFEDFLDPDEQTRFEALMSELEAAAAAATTTLDPATAGAEDFWIYPPHSHVRIFCGRLAPEDAGEYGEPTNPNYMRFRNAADVDALFELWGHLRSQNPTATIRVRLGTDFSPDDLDTHLIVLGNIGQEQSAGSVVPADALPIRQVHVSDLEGEVFEIDGASGPEQFRPVFAGDQLVEDVGMLARVVSPLRIDRTLTVCSGVFTRGVFGAVRATTSEPTAADNLAVLPDLVPDTSSFALLMRVRVMGHAVPTPDLRDPSVVLYVDGKDS